MSEIVKCEICGGVYNRSYLSGHKRLAHGKKDVASLVKTQREGVNAIRTLYTKLSDKNKEKVRKQLTN